MRRDSTLRVLFDGMILSNSIQEQTILVSEPGVWGKRVPVQLQQERTVVRKYRGRTSEETGPELEHLRRVAELARADKIECWTSQEITFETIGRRREYSLDPSANPFHKIAFRQCRLPYERTVTWAAFEEDTFKEEKQKFLSSIANTRFLILNKATNRHHTSDCYHLWTAEINNLDVFLTVEHAFRNALVHQKAVTSAVKIMSPEELCAYFETETIIYENL